MQASGAGQVRAKPIGGRGRSGNAAVSFHVEFATPVTNSAASSPGQPRRTIVVLVLALCAIYVVSQFLRNSVGVIAPDIAVELSLSPEALGILSSVFFFAFASAQIPLGIAIDRYGPRWCLFTSLGLAVAGCVLFALAPTLDGLVAARILMGLGCSTMFMAPLTIYTRWFRQEQFSMLAGLQLGFGGLGTLIATAPLAYSTAEFGWRNTFLAVGAAAAIIGIAVVAVVRDSPPGSPPPTAAPQSLADSIKGLARVFRIQGVFRLFTMHFFAYSTLIAILGLWGGPFLSDVHGLDLVARGDVLFLMAMAQIIGMLAWGPTDRLFGQRRLPVTIGALASVAILFALVALGDRSVLTVTVLFVMLSLTTGYAPVMMAHGRGLFPPELVGRGITFLNIGTMGGVFAMQAATGALIGRFQDNPGETAAPFGLSGDICGARICPARGGVRLSRGAGARFRPETGLNPAPRNREIVHCTILDHTVKPIPLIFLDNFDSAIQRFSDSANSCRARTVKKSIYFCAPHTHIVATRER